MSGPGEWITTSEHGEGLSQTTIESLSGISWHEAPEPGPWHHCTPQTRGWIGLNQTERCACGAIRHNRSPWMEKNARRESRKRDRREARMPRVQVTCLTCSQPYQAIKDSHQAQQELCTHCWGERFVASGGRLA